ncbi:MAG: TetR-like C-terminal domain-containing protein [Eubacteriales bacterium]|nr:TetR-like C-terminal domain-containing protein [Eubacteriales bacterium]
MNIKNNQRFYHTEKCLEQGFLSLCQTTPPEKITVSQLCKTVSVNRSTFYAHFLDIPDLIQNIGASHMKEMIPLLEATGNGQSFPFTKNYFLSLFSYIKENQSFYNIYFNHSNPRSVESSFTQCLESAIKPYLERFPQKSPEAMHYHFIFFKAGLISVLSQWVKNGCKEKPEELADIILQNLPKEAL